METATDLHHETVGDAEYVPFEGRMVTPAARDAALEFRRRPSVRGSHVTGATPEEKAEAILAASHQEFLREKRQRERDEQREARAEKLSKAREIELDLMPVSEYPEVKAIREKLEAVRSKASRSLADAEAALSDARAAAEAADEKVAQLEAAIATDPKERDAAVIAASHAWKAVDQAEAELNAVKREADRSERAAGILRERLEAEERKAAARHQAAGERLLREAILKAKGLTTAASEAHDDLFRMTLELRKRGVSLPVFVCYLEELRSPEVAGSATAYGEWLQRLAAHYPTDEREGENR